VTGRIVYCEADAYTLKLKMVSCPFGSAVNRNEDSAMAASIAIKQDDMKAKPLFTRAYKLYIPFERVRTWWKSKVQAQHVT
jgi:hypothetical protein